MCHEIFVLQVFSWFESIWSPGKQGKVFFNYVSISPRYSNFIYEKTPQCALYCRVELRSLHPTTESISAVCIPPRSQALRCASHNRVKGWKVQQKKLRFVHLAAESSSTLCIIPQSLTLRCASPYRVNNLTSVCFHPKFLKAISLWCLKIFIWNWYCKSQIVQGIFFATKFFRKNEVERCSKYENTKNRHFWISLTQQCASHREVRVTKFLKKLRSLHPTAESDSMVCFSLGSQTQRCASHHKVKLCSVLGVKLCGVHHTVESKCTTWSQNRNLYKSLGAFKGTIRRNPVRCEQFYHVIKDLREKKFIC